MDTADNTKIPVSLLQLNRRGAAKLPIWEGEVFKVNDEKLVAGLPAGAGEFFLPIAKATAIDVRLR